MARASPTAASTTPAIFNELVDYVAAQALPVRTVGVVITRGAMTAAP